MFFDTNQGLREFLQVQERDRLDRATGEELALEKGIEKGREEGMEKVALSMLSSGLDVNFIRQHTGLPEEDIINLKNTEKK